MPTLDLGLEVTPSPSLEATTSTPVEIPCGRCRACGLVERDAHPDVHLVEVQIGKRDIAIEQIRDLEHRASLKPYEAPLKVFIIVDAQHLNAESSNALLKTLEEPGEDTVLLLTATDASSVLPTIASRCQEVPLRPVPETEIRDALTATGVEPARADLIARLSGGRPGWALTAVSDESLLEKRLAQVEQLEGLLALQPVARLGVAAQFTGDGAAARDAARGALDVWQTWWRDALLVREGCEDLAVNVDRLDRLRAVRATPEACLGAIRRLRAAREQVDSNANVRLAMEALFLDLPAAPNLGMSL